MKKIALYTLVIVFALFLVECEYDNFDPPTSILSGEVTYNGNPVGVRSNGTQLELWQRGYDLFEKIPVHIAQDGTFSARLYDGDYKLVRLAGAPWEPQTDSISVTVKGNTTVNVPVIPYFIITNESFTLNSDVITSSFLVTRIGSRDIASLHLYIGTTSIVDASNNRQSVNLTTGLEDLSTVKTMNLTLNDAMKARDFVYARLAIRISGIGERYYSPVQKIMLK